ncbi:phosphotransferase enzyme family protein [Paenibacillus harenae]|uniref:phosphotransferase enzyme family protein n=1 Tax=Paenibacillus harenae TaxID=306543 RepID=UPI00040136EA|nr:phosphotransferase [Paenibacillus harenae]
MQMREESVKELLQQYGINQPTVVWLKHSGNRTYKVTDSADGKDYLFRIHQPVTANMEGVQHTRSGLQAELQLLKDIAAETLLTVQMPVRNRSGSVLTEITEGSRPLICSLLTWIDGRELKKEDLEDRQLACMLGMRTAELHRFTRGYGGVRPGDRPSYGRERSELMIRQISRGIEKGLFSRKEQDILENCMRLMNEKLSDTLAGPGAWGMIHADLNRSNILVTEAGELAIIDYGLSGYGYYMLDLAMAALNAPSAYRDHVLKGYFGEKRIPDWAETVLGGFMLMAVLGYYAFHMENEKVHPWIRERMPKLCEDRCLPFLDGESIFKAF